MSWLIYKRGTIQPFRTGTILSAIVKFNNHDCGALQPKTLYINEGDKLHWSWEKKSSEEFWRQLLLFLQTPKKVNRHFAKIDSAAERALSASRRILRIDLQKLSNQKLTALYKNLLIASQPAHFVLNMEIDIIDLYFEDFFRRELFKELKPAARRLRSEEIFSGLTKSVERSYVNKRELSIDRLALKRDFSAAAAKKVYNKFWWTNLGWENMQPYSPEYFQKLIKHRSADKKLADKTKNLVDFIKNNRRIRAGYLKEFNFSEKLKYWLALSDRYAYYHDKRKELQVRTLYSLTLILREAARRFNFRTADLEWLWPEELVDIIAGRKLDRAEINRRKKCVAALASYKEFKFWSGADALKIKNKYIKETVRRVRELKGLGVTSGVVSGRVKICAGAKDALTKIKPGDILVCPMTLPDYLPAMRKARAIITDEGGITCHAAIIAREFKIPCIVGTKIATQAFKDNDLVEVNAREGIIKIIE